MKAMILAAGLGKRMRPLTDNCPKPLLPLLGKPLLTYHIEKLVALGITDIVINHAYLGEQIVNYIGDGRQFGANIQLSGEPQGAYETAGGIINALPLLTSNAESLTSNAESVTSKVENQPFMVVNGDIWTDYDFDQIPRKLNDVLAHLVLVNNPPHNLDGDFAIDEQGFANESGAPRYTFSGISVYHPSFFEGLKVSKQPLAPLLRKAMGKGLVSASLYQGRWTDVGTPQRLQQLADELTNELTDELTDRPE